jgi:hypothetical protein
MEEQLSLQSMFPKRLAFLRQAYATKGAQQVSFRLVCPKGHAKMGCLDSSAYVVVPYLAFANELQYPLSHCRKCIQLIFS